MKHAVQRSLPCGCKLCGCVCEVHCDERTPRSCLKHAILRTVLQEAGALVSLALFCGMVLVWLAIWSH